MSTTGAFDRSVEDIGNIVEFGHLNLCVPDQRAATLFYITGLGLTRDPFLRTGVENMWINVGTSQLHLPTGPAQKLRGVIGLVVPDLALLIRRLESVQARLEGTQFSFTVGRDDTVAVTCPWGNRVRCHLPDAARFGRIVRGMPYLEIDAAPRSGAGIVAFYRTILATPASQGEDDRGRFARVHAGLSGSLIFRETEAALPPFDGHHVEITLADFSGPYSRLLARDLITEESSQHQYRFEKVMDLDTGDVLAVIEHEVRSMRHPAYGRIHTSRDPEQTNNGYTSAAEPSAWWMPPGD